MASPRQPLDKATQALLVAELRDAVLHGFGKHQWLSGSVYGCSGGRFDDATPIITSLVVRRRSSTAGRVFETRQTRYLVTSWLVGGRE